MSDNSALNCTMEKANFVIVPWQNAIQFRKVYAYLYSSELVKKRWAVDQISVWENRCHPSLPMAIEASLMLTRAVIQDILLSSGISFCQERDIQMMYSMALVRFVNLVLENSAKHQSNIATKAQIAKRLGIPSWIVDLRNEASHSFWPSVPSLRMACEAALKYLNESYWEKEASILKNFEKKPFNGSETEKLLRRFVSLEYHVIRAEESQKKSESFHRNVEECNTLLKKLTIAAQRNKKGFVTILVSSSIFIPHDDELKMLMTLEERLNFEEENEENNFEQDTIPPVPEEFEKLWKRLLNMLNMFQAIPLLLEDLLKTQDHRTELGKKLAISWVMNILRIHCLGYRFEETSLRKLFRRKGIVVNWQKLFYAAVSKPCLYTPYIFPLLFSHLDLKEDVTRYILNLLAISLGQAKCKSVKLPSSHRVYTVEQLKRVKKIRGNQEESTKSSDESIWGYPEDSCFRSWPIGFVVNIDFKRTDENFADILTSGLEDQMDIPEKYILGNENDSEEDYIAINDEPDTEDEMDLSERRTFLYKIK